MSDKDYYDIEKGLNSALTNLFVEGDYAPLDNLRFYASSMLTVDWIYQLKHKDSSWDEKLFAKSKNDLNVDDKYWQILKEAHFTWTPKNLLFRVGKQIVAWGETDGFRLMDQINPLDQRRGFADVEFETSIIPIWLVRAEYYLPKKPAWLQDLGFEFVYNPNADFITNQGIKSGNDEGGIWAPDIELSGIGYLGSARSNISKPKKWKEGNEFAFRIKGSVYDALITLNAFYGRDNDPVRMLVSPFVSPIPPNIYAPDGRLILHPFQEGKYPLFRFVGATFSKDIIPLRASFLGGVAPLLRLEAFYAFDNTFAFNIPGTVSYRFEKSDEFRGAIGVDWKVKIPFLNPRAYFTISPQFYYQRIVDFPSIEDVFATGDTPVKRNNYKTTLMISTSYLHNKLNPSFFWLRDINSKSDYFRLQLVYDLSHQWHFTLGASLFHGNKTGEGFQLFNHKDQIYFKVAYKWG